MALGARLAGVLRGGLAVWLQGNLGAGKTTLVRGLLRGLFTRVYLSEPESLVLPGSVPAGRRGTLIARPDAANAGYEWDVRLSGPHETVFFEL